MITSTLSKSLKRRISVWIWLSCLAKSSAVAVLANSAGWIVTGPKAYHALAPLIVFPKMSTPTKSSIAKI